MRLRVCPTVMELPGRLWAAVVNRPTKGSMLSARKGSCGGCDGRAYFAGRNRTR